MAAFRIFYAWQRDRPANLCRTLIRRALDDAAEQVGEGLDIQDAQRIDVEIDQDTQGEPGSPAIAETIFQKIAESDAFVGDLTFTGRREGKPGSPVPNPNVLLEYGYALHALGHERVIAVFNEEFGCCSELSFDLRHRRWPITYLTSGDGPDERSREARRTQRKQLAKELVAAIKTIVQKEGKRKADFGEADTGPLVDEFPLEGGVHVEHPARQCQFSSGAKILLSLRSARGELSLTNVKASQIARNALMPLASEQYHGSGWSQARVPHGVATIPSPGPGGAVEFASILLRDGSLYGVDCYHVGRRHLGAPENPIVPVTTVEEILRDGLRNFLDVAQQQLSLPLPLNVGVALEGVKGHLVVIRPLATRIPILEERIEDRFQIDDYDVDPAKALKPFFEMIYDEVGLERP